MHLFTKENTLRKHLDFVKAEGHKIAFVPTMGALHEGHLSLINLAAQYADLKLCSIFINPSQFNHVSDLKTYPRLFDQDCHLLEKTACDIVFAPTVEEVYPPGMDFSLNLDLGNLDKVMEGEFRPGHFKGMLEVVKRLLDLTRPDYLIMGQKDFQQFTLVRHMIRQLNIPTRLIIGPTLRESDGLAMSSRNLRLNPEIRTRVPVIFDQLNFLKKYLLEITPGTLVEEAIKVIEKSGLRCEYFQIVDALTLDKVTDPNNHENIVACTAVWAGEVRLIDNLLLKGEIN